MYLIEERVQMSLTPSSMLALGTRAPDFTLMDVADGAMRSLQQLKSERATVVMFICNHCPYVKHVQQGLVRLADDYLPKGVSIVAISSNDARSYPDDAPDKMRTEAQRAAYRFPYLYDDTQRVARDYQAACTPDFFVFDADLRLAYRGQFDDSRPGNRKPVSGRDIRAALDALLAGRSVNADQIPSVGCNIKWARPRD